jgi:4-alpha-glucanotransferase
MRLDNSARMNTPGKAAGNWAWRVGDRKVWKRLAPEAAALRKLAYTYDRLAKGQRLDPKED